jgi:hypothetical protein
MTAATRIRRVYEERKITTAAAKVNAKADFYGQLIDAQILGTLDANAEKFRQQAIDRELGIDAYLYLDLMLRRQGASA